MKLIFLVATAIVAEGGAVSVVAGRSSVASAPSVPAALVGDWRKVDPARVHAINREEVDRILDKISKSGIASLTPQERLFQSNFFPPHDPNPNS